MTPSDRIELRTRLEQQVVWACHSVVPFVEAKATKAYWPDDS